MKIFFPRICGNVTNFIRDNRAQSVSEYALICALLAFGATAGYRGLADEISAGYNQISALFASSGLLGSGSGSGGSGSGGQGSGGSPAGSPSAPGGGPTGGPAGGPSGGGPGGHHHHHG